MKLQDGEESHRGALLRSEQVSEGGRRERTGCQTPETVRQALFPRGSCAMQQEVLFCFSLFLFPSGEFVREHCPCVGFPRLLLTCSRRSTLYSSSRMRHSLSHLQLHSFFIPFPSDISICHYPFIFLAFLATSSSSFPGLGQ